MGLGGFSPCCASCCCTCRCRASSSPMESGKKGPRDGRLRSNEKGLGTVASPVQCSPVTQCGSVRCLRRRWPSYCRAKNVKYDSE